MLTFEDERTIFGRDYAIARLGTTPEEFVKNLRYAREWRYARIFLTRRNLLQYVNRADVNKFIASEFHHDIPRLNKNSLFSLACKMAHIAKENGKVALKEMQDMPCGQSDHWFEANVEAPRALAVMYYLCSNLV